MWILHNVFYVSYAIYPSEMIQREGHKTMKILGKFFVMKDKGEFISDYENDFTCVQL